jgi:hypothetical protein
MFYFLCFNYRMTKIRSLNVTGQWGATFFKIGHKVFFFSVEPQSLVGWGFLITDSSRSYSETYIR